MKIFRRRAVPGLGLAAVLAILPIAGTGSGPASAGGGGTRPQRPLALAEYRVWHGLPSHADAFSGAWWLGGVERPYDSLDPSVLRRHVTRARALGIDGFVVNWYGPPVEGASSRSASRLGGGPRRPAPAGDLDRPGPRPVRPRSRRALRRVLRLGPGERRALGRPGRGMGQEVPRLRCLPGEIVTGESGVAYEIKVWVEGRPEPLARTVKVRAQDPIARSAAVKGRPASAGR